MTEKTAEETSAETADETASVPVVTETEHTEADTEDTASDTESAPAETESLSEEELRRAMEQGTFCTVDTFVCRDFDGDGRNEAFGIARNEELVSQVIFVNAKGEALIMEEEPTGSFPLSTPEELYGFSSIIEAGGKSYFNVVSGASTVYCTGYLYGVEGDECRTMDVSGKYNAFGERDGKLIALKDELLYFHFNFEYDMTYENGEFKVSDNRPYTEAENLSRIVCDSSDKWLPYLRETAADGSDTPFIGGFIDLDFDGIPEFAVYGGEYGAHSAKGYFVYKTDGDGLSMMLTDDAVTYADEPNISFWSGDGDIYNIPLYCSRNKRTGEMRWFSADRDGTADEEYYIINEYDFSGGRVHTKNKAVCTEYKAADKPMSFTMNGAESTADDYIAFYEELVNIYNTEIVKADFMCDSNTTVKKCKESIPVVLMTSYLCGVGGTDNNETISNDSKYSYAEHIFECSPAAKPPFEDLINSLIEGE